MHWNRLECISQPLKQPPVWQDSHTERRASFKKCVKAAGLLSAGVLCYSLLLGKESESVPEGRWTKVKNWGLCSFPQKIFQGDFNFYKFCHSEYSYEHQISLTFTSEILGSNLNLLKRMKYLEEVGGGVKNPKNL